MQQRPITRFKQQLGAVPMIDAGKIHGDRIITAQERQSRGPLREQPLFKPLFCSFEKFKNSIRLFGLCPNHHMVPKGWQSEGLSLIKQLGRMRIKIMGSDIGKQGMFGMCCLNQHPRRLDKGLM